MQSIIYFLQSIKRSPISLFVVVAGVFGLFFILVTPPFQAPDEKVHFMRAYQISEFNLAVDQVGSIAGGSLPNSINKTFLTTYAGLEFNPGAKYDIHRNKTALGIKQEPEIRRNYDFSSTAAYSPVSYLPQSTGIFLGRIFGASPLLLMYMGRLFNLIAWACVVALSIKIIPRKKWALVAVGLLPMALFQASSLSPDVMATGMAMLFLSFILYFADRNKILNKKELLILLSLGVLTALSKQIMFILLPLVLVLPKRVFQSYRQSVLCKALIVVVPLTIVMAWLYLVRDVNIVSSTANHQNQSEQIKYIVLHPFSYISTLWNTHFFTWGDEVERSLIGDFGWADTPLSLFWVVFGYIELALLFGASNGRVAKKWLNNKQKIVVATIALLYCLAVSTALYVFYSPVGFKIIVGLQGRYFIPVALLLIPLVSNQELVMSKKAYKRLAIYAPIILLIASLITIYTRYYINNV